MKLENPSTAEFQLTVSLAELKKLCTSLAGRLNVGDCLLLNGPLGSGKTQFVKCVAEALDCKDAVTSPTYGLANFYETGGSPILHIDTYRLESLPEFYQLGLEDFFPSHISLIEWGDKIASSLEEYLEVSFEFADQGSERNPSHDDSAKRILRFTAAGEHYREMIEGLKDAWNGENR